ncbi:2'-5'-oligoadenylate synthase 3 [Orchesella cincta]|uniref:2'-5'-oligoadenylate synthase 3 n=1 Tax=Orchesella cincta TaxID=48709 RepID=A0A1D2MVE8_ORCCI|nr:2'-5'-oligoadenylate synthase 3 [Orchesella cincta]
MIVSISFKMSNSKIAKRTSAELIEFSDSVNPSESYIKDGRRLVEAVFTKLKGARKVGAQSKFKVDRVFYGGSVGKRTSVIYPDFDCVVFLNEVEPPLDEILKEFETMLKDNATELSIIPDSIKRTWITIMVRFENGVEMDLLAACNLSKRQDPKEQRRLVIERIKADPEKLSPRYSSSLAEMQLDYLKTQSGFTHQLIRLAKYWYKSCSLDESVYGGSAMMEIICVTVVEENGDSISMLEAFKMVLHKVVRMDSLKIAFIQEDGKWKSIPEGGGMRKYAANFDSKIISRTNYIIEPANPYNDMAKNISPKVYAKLKKFGTVMIKRVEKLEATQTNDMITVVGQVVTSTGYFEPFPLRLSDEYSDGVPTEVLVDYQYAKYKHNSAEPKHITNKSSFDQDKFKPRKIVTKTILNNLAFLIRAPKPKNVGDKTYIPYTDGVAQVGLEDVKGAVKRLTSVNFKGNCIKETNSDSAHNGCDVTLFAPYICDGKRYAVRMSLKWSSGGSCIRKMLLSSVTLAKTFSTILILSQCQKISAAVSPSQMIASQLKSFQNYPERQSHESLQEKFPESTITRIQMIAPKSEASFISDPKTIMKLRSKTRTNSRFLRTFPPLELYKFAKRAGASSVKNDFEDDDHRKILLGNPNKIRARLENGNSPVFYIRLPPAPYVFVPGIGYVSPHPYSNGHQPGMSMGFPGAPIMMAAGGHMGGGGSSGGFMFPSSMDQDLSNEQPSQNVISLPLKFLSNGRPHQIESPKKKKKPPKQENSSENKGAAVISGGKYSFNGRPTAVFVVRSPAAVIRQVQGCQSRQ